MIYKTATDHVNNHPYMVLTPPYVQQIHSVVLKGDLFAPIYESFDPNLMQRSVITIAKMVELIISNTTFTIIDDYDVLAILHQIDAYVEEVYPLMSDKQIKDYLDRILKLRARIYILFRRILNRRPQWKASYSHGQDIFGAILQLYGAIGLKVDTPDSLFEELSVCPTVRAHPDRFSDHASNVKPSQSQPGDRIVYGV